MVDLAAEGKNLAEAAIETGRIDKIRIWQIEVELAAVPLTRPPDNAQPLAAAADWQHQSVTSRCSANMPMVRALERQLS